MSGHPQHIPSATMSAMIRTAVLLALVTYAASWSLFGENKKWKSGLSHTLMEFNKIPQTKTAAEKAGYKKVAENAGTIKGHEDYEIWGNPENHAVGLLIKSDNVTGAQINLRTDEIVPYFPIEDQGVQQWTSDFTGETVTYYSLQLIHNKDGVYFKYGSEVIFVPSDLRDLDTTVWNLQACMPFMGTHYYYKMTKSSTTCDKAFAPFFILSDPKTNQIIGMGMMILGDCPNAKGFEHPGTLAVKLIVPDAPQCLYDLVDAHKVCTMHYYFVDSPGKINCIPFL